MRAWILAERIKASCIWHLICNIATFNRANVTMAIPSLHNCLIPERNSFRYHAVLLLMIGLLLKIIDSQKKRGKNRFIGSCSIFLIYPYTSPALQPIYIYIYTELAPKLTWSRDPALGVAFFATSRNWSRLDLKMYIFPTLEFTLL